MKILIVSPSWIGDTVISHSLYQLLFLNYHKKIIIDVITSMWCKSVISCMNEVNRILITPYQHGSLNLNQCYKLGKILKKKKYDQAIILPNSFKSTLIPFLSGIPIRTGWRGEMRYGFLNDLRILNKSLFPLMVQRYAALAYDKHHILSFSDFPDPLPLPTLYIQRNQIDKILFKFYLNKIKKKWIGLCPGSATDLSKNWPHYHYINLAIKLILSGYHVLILGSASDRLLIGKFFECDKLQAKKQNYHNLMGLTSLYEAMIILSCCLGIVSNDSGLMHIACALHIPVIGLYKSNGYYCSTPPLFCKSKIICSNIIYNNINKKKKYHDYDLCNKYHPSLINITPKKVFETLKIILN